MNEYLGDWNIGLKTNPEPPAEKPHAEDAEELECIECGNTFWTDRAWSWIQGDFGVLCHGCMNRCIKY